jgi:hypothetical protein
MSSITRMSPLDLLDLNLTNLDPLTENYDLGFYLNYLTKWPSLFSTVKDRDAGVVGYSMDIYQTSSNNVGDLKLNTLQSWANSKNNTPP